jgi:hypothetical protein
LYAAWNAVGIDTKDYAQFVIETNYFASDALAWVKKGNTKELYIKASEILINDTNKQKLFEAGGNEVYIAGWNVNEEGFYKTYTGE